jgi:transposase
VADHPTPAAPTTTPLRRPTSIDDRAAAGIVYQLQTGIPWRLLPARQLGCGSPITCWRRLQIRYERRADILVAFLHLASR